MSEGSLKCDNLHLFLFQEKAPEPYFWQNGRKSSKNILDSENTALTFPVPIYFKSLLFWLWSSSLTELGNLT